MITVEEMLRLPLFSEALIIAGAKGIGRCVRSVDVIEVPDAENWIIPDCFLFTTAYAFKDAPDALCRLIRAGVERRISGFGIKLGRFIEDLPGEAYRIADEFSLPIVRLHRSTAYIPIIREVMSAIFDREALMRSKSLRQDCLGRLLYGTEPERAVEELENIGWEPHTPVRVVVLRVRGTIAPEKRSGFYELFVSLRRDLLLTVRDDDVIFLMKNPSEEDLLRLLRRFREEAGRESYLIGLGNPHSLSCGARRSLHEARKALDAAAALGCGAGVFSFSEVSVLSFLDDHPGREEYLISLRNLLSPLLTYDREHEASLCETLKVFLECDRCCKEAADRLHIHRNTLRYRLEKIGELLSPESLTGHSAFLLRIALTILSLN